MSNNYIYECKKELELYVHIPFCIKKCAYCDFLSAPADERSRFVYMEALKKEIHLKAVSSNCCADSEKSEYVVTSIFVGGGTPTVMDGDLLADLLECIKAEFFVDEHAEITFECNPGTVDYKKLKRCRDAGYNRVSIGLQSAIDEELKLLGRIHNYETFEKTYTDAVKCGFENINVDLMSAIPGQSFESIEKSLDKILALTPRPKHISAYSLILEEGTVFWDMNETGELELPDEDSEREMHWRIIDRLEQEGYLAYELSNLAIPGYECRHNIGYWIRKPYLGFGIGAASLFEGKRQTNTRSLTEYLEYFGSEEQVNKGIPLSEDIVLNRDDEIEEYMFLGLRMNRGISVADFEKTFDTDFNDLYGEIITQNIENGLLEKENEYIRLTRRGQDLANYVFSQFILG